MIGMHIVRVKRVDDDYTVVTNGDVPNSSGEPTLDAYLVAEAGDNYLPITPITQDVFKVVTVSVEDMNGA